jgi:hypothetical protein
VPLTIACEHSRLVTLEEFIDHVQSQVDLHDMDSVAAAAPMFRGLANDQELVVRKLNLQVKECFRQEMTPASQTVYLGGGPGFYVRANTWPSNADLASGGRVYQDQFGYHQLHDHNYNFMTVSYFGPGYVTENYEYDFDRIQGYVGEKVDLRFIERVHFTRGMVMLYRASVDVHTQFPPDDLAITLNIMIATPEVRSRDQYFFDAQGIIVDHPGELDTSRRISIVKMAGHVGNGDTRQLLDDLARQHPCRRTRLAASDALVRLEPADAARVWERACGDKETLVKNVAKQRLEGLGR